jgi:MFS family permease
MPGLARKRTRGGEGGRVGPLQSLATATAASTLGALPLFMIGAMAVPIREELGIDPLGLGTAVGVLSAAAASGAGLGGRLSERLGPFRSMAVSVGMTAVALVGLGSATRSWPGFCSWLVAAGAGSGLCQPASNQVVADTVPETRQGLAFGVKQAAIPAAGLVSAAALPTLAVTLGWRSAFTVLGAAALIYSLVGFNGIRHELPSRLVVSSGQGSRMVELRPLVLAAFLGGAAANAMGAFLVAGAVASGVSISRAAMLLAAGSASGIASRVILGGWADRTRQPPLRMVVGLLLAGALGLWLLTLSPAPVPTTAGAILGFAAGWGWPGLLNLAVVRFDPATVARTTGVLQAGLFAGALAGPPAFGLLVREASYDVAWMVGGLGLAAASLCVLEGKRRLSAPLGP